MEYKNIFSFDVEWNYRTMTLFAFLLIIPNFLGMLNISTVWGFKLHFFQVAVFLAALIYGPTGGLLSGMVGSVYSAFIMHNPYIVGGNMILGFFVGLFARHKMHTIVAVMLAFIVQLPWLVITDYYLIHMPWPVLWKLIVALALSNLVWATLAHYSARPARNALRC